MIRREAFPGQGRMKPEQLEIARLKREVLKPKTERDILKKPRLLREGIYVKFGFIAMPGCTTTQSAPPLR
jgi:hypothetical protein